MGSPDDDGQEQARASDGDQAVESLVALPRMGSLQHERTALWMLARYLPVLIGVVLSISFGSSVLYDTEDLAHGSWSAGGELLGVFSDFARLLLVPLFLFSALLRRGPRCLVRLVDVDAERIVLEDEGGKTRVIPRSAVHSLFSYANADGTTSVTLELSQGLFLLGLPGDRITLGLEHHEAKRIAAAFATEEVEVRLGTKSPRFGGLLAGTSLVLGALVGIAIFRGMWAHVQHLPKASYYIPIIPDAERGWLGGLAITAMGAVHALGAWLSSPSDVLLSEEGLTLKSWLGPRVIPFADIETIALDGRGFVIELTSEERIERSWLGADPDKLRGFVEAVRARVATAKEDVSVPSGLERGSDSIPGWRRALAQRAGASGYRVGALDTETLAACVTAPAVPREVRVGAAIALSSGPESEGKARLRELAEAVSQPSLRVLVEQLAEGEAEDEDIAYALRARR